VPRKARKGRLETFATNNSANVQATLYLMAQRLITENAHVQSPPYALPNKHYIAVGLSYLGVENVVLSKAEVFMPIAAP
ncbi:hypothetical protein C8J57DRAFT_981058, partial [Mycena rebaudengoi]